MSTIVQTIETPTVVQTTDVTMVVQGESVTNVITVGVQGPQGPAGADAAIEQDDFTVVSNGEVEWNVLASATTLLSVLINQIDYVGFCAIDPPGSGNVVYTPPVGGYTTEIGDVVHVEYM